MARAVRTLVGRTLGAFVLSLSLGLAAIASADALTFEGVRAAIVREFPDVPFVTADALSALLARPPASRPVLLDARSAEEFAVSHLDGAIRIDPDHPDPSLAGRDRRRTIVVYCSVGYRSARVARALAQAGFVDVRNLEGGIFAWANAGRAVHRGRRRVRDVHPYDDHWGSLLHPELRTRVPRGR